jgi:hypothetical protein
MRQGVSRSVWRLFGQRRDPQWRGVPAAEAGLAGPRSTGVFIDDEHQLEKLQKAETPRDRMLAAMGYLMKVTKNGYSAASEYGDPLATGHIDAVCEEVAEHIISAAQRAKDHLRHYDPLSE